MADQVIQPVEVGRAITAGELRLHYQPVLAATTRAVVGAEALVRWERPGHGLLAPAAFVPQLEGTPVMGRLTTWVVTEALDQCVRWRTAGHLVPVSVNVSASLVGDRAGLDRLRAGLLRRRLPPGLLTVEVTESVLVTDRRAAGVLAGLRRLGARLSLDDFGTGYGSIGRLKDFRFDELKIDRSFVTRLRGSLDDEAIVRSVLELGHRLGLEVVAEGIEDEATAQLLADLGCDRLQGFHTGRPGPPETFPHPGGAAPWSTGPAARPVPVPADEADRQVAVDALELAGTEPDPVLDDVVALARDLVGAPMAMVTLVDRDRQWFAARIGVAETEVPRDVGFCAHALTDPGLLEVPDAGADPRFADFPYVAGEPYVRFYAGAPLVTSGGHTVGTLCVLDTRPRRLTAGERDALSRLARIALARIEARRADLLVRRLTAALSELGRLSRITDLPAAVHTFVRAARDLLDADGASLMLADVPGGVLFRTVGAVGDGVPPDLSDLVVDTRESPLAAALATSRTPAFVADARGGSPVETRLIEQLGVASALVLPVVAGDAVAGAVFIWWTTRHRMLPDSWPETARLLADTAGSTLTRLQALDELRVAAESDPLTGLRNRRGFLRRTSVLPAGSVVAILDLDLDHVTAVNDEHGHLAGGGALQDFAGVLRSALRSGDVAGRWGGAGFVLALPAAGSEGGLLMLDRLRARWRSAGGERLGVTFSTGVVTLRPDEPAEQALRRADEALYAAKGAGRDRDVVG